MDIFVYSDESGTFDKTHNEWFVFGGLIFPDKESRDIASRKYSAAEKAIAHRYEKGVELKASYITNKDKGKLFRSLNTFHKFCVVINQKKLRDDIFAHKKIKQRYLDYALKRGIKQALTNLFNDGVINASDVDNIHLFVDEHTTATDGIYELRESVEQEFKYGTYNFNYEMVFSPILPYMNSVTIEFCNSAKKPLIRAADIIANRAYFYANKNNTIEETSKFSILYLP